MALADPGGGGGAPGANAPPAGISTPTHAHRACVEGLPADLASMLSTNAAARSSERVTRQDRLLRPPAMRTAAGQRSFAYRAASLLNKLPESVRGRRMSSFCRAVNHFFSQDMTWGVSVCCVVVCVCVCVHVCAFFSFTFFPHRDYWPLCFRYFMTKDTE